MAEGFHVYNQSMKGLCFFFFMAMYTITLSSCGKGATAIYMKKGKGYFEDKNYQMAIRFFDKTLEVDSNDMDAKYYKALCYYNLGHNHFACEQMVKLLNMGYHQADSSLKMMGCFYFQEDTLMVK